MQIERLFVAVALAYLILHAVAANAGDEVLCVVLDSQPAVLDESTYASVHKGLCGVGTVEPKDKERDDVRSLVLFAIASGNMKTVDMILETRGVSRLLYSLHSASDGLVTHSVFAYDPVRSITALGGRTWDREKKLKNADEKFAREAARMALNGLAVRPAIEELAAKGGPLGVEIASIINHVSEPTQFLRPVPPTKAPDRSAVEAVLRSNKIVWPGPYRELAWCAYFLLTGDQNKSIAACERFAKSGPKTLADITRTNLLLATHRYAEALSVADLADRELGFDLFLMSRSWALAGLGRPKDAQTVLTAFINRNGPAWEKAALTIIAAAHAAGDEQNKKFLASLAREAGMSDESRAAIEALAGSGALDPAIPKAPQSVK